MKAAGIVLILFVGLVLLAGCADEEQIARYQAEQAQAQASQAQAEAMAVQAQAEAQARVAEAEAQARAAESYAQAVEAQARSSEKQSEFMLVVLVVMVFWASLLALGVFVIVLELARRLNRQPAQVVYLPAPGYYHQLPPYQHRALQPGARGNSVIIWPDQVGQDYVYRE